ncbi:unnamed protein product [Adineta ricciae]|uniref:G-protein coupled receptors family 1 profile domain-containing protein n=1 Tax=Adineta ricciae TaxID=249248 RepID=A0A814UCH0_ADIRI|nr:unnamed protein product [Adineta ricciae]CAF1180275.1 unnamed protein product [Adineta ricciae]
MIGNNPEILYDIINWITFYASFLTIIIGTLGGLCNLLTFTSKQLRYNPCAFYFLCSTVFDMMYVLFGGTVRIMQDHYTNRLPTESNVFCKCRIYLVVALPTLSTSFLMVASIDRCLSTSNSSEWRQLSKMHIAWRVAIVTFLLALLSTAHILILYELHSKETDHMIYQCLPREGFYTKFMTLYSLSISPFLIYGIMFSCTLITLRRVRTLGYRMKMLCSKRNSRISRVVDHHLITILVVQVGLGMLLTCFRCGFLIYYLWTSNQHRHSSRHAFEVFLDKLTLVVYYLNFAKSFPVNMLTSLLFRRVFCQRIHYLLTSSCRLKISMLKLVSFA